MTKTGDRNQGEALGYSLAMEMLKGADA